MVLWTDVEQYMVVHYQNVTDRYKVKNYMTTQCENGYKVTQFGTRWK